MIEAAAIAIDNLANVYVTGKGGSGSDTDYLTIKYGQGPHLRLLRRQLQAPRQQPQGQRHQRHPNCNGDRFSESNRLQLHPRHQVPMSGPTATATPTATPTPMQTCCQYVTSSGTGTIVPGTNRHRQPLR